MPVSYAVDTSRQLVLVYAWGTLTSDDIRQCRAMIRADSAFQRSFRQLVDLSDVTCVDVCHELVVHMALTPLFTKDTPRAFVACTEEHLSLLRVFGLYEAGANPLIRIFRHVWAAEEWLTLADPCE